MTAARHSLLRSAASLGLVAVAGTTLLAGVHHLTAERIAAQERRAVLEQLEQIIPANRYDNPLQDDWITVSDEQHFPRGQQVVAYRARRGGQPVAVIFRFAAMDGYNGPIHLLAGVEADGSLLGVRVTSHRETPGLGDGIEAERSDWIHAFDGQSLRSPEPARWGVRRDGGAFDQFTGATITPRAVVEAVRRALEYHEVNRQALFEAPAAAPQEAGE
ncbi:MAG: electron transport complex subunit RsxG [Lysobacterales bacterium]